MAAVVGDGDAHEVPRDRVRGHRRRRAARVVEHAVAVQVPRVGLEAERILRRRAARVQRDGRVADAVRASGGGMRVLVHCRRLSAQRRDHAVERRRERLERRRERVRRRPQLRHRCGELREIGCERRVRPGVAERGQVVRREPLVREHAAHVGGESVRDDVGAQRFVRLRGCDTGGGGCGLCGEGGERSVVGANPRRQLARELLRLDRVAERPGQVACVCSALVALDRREQRDRQRGLGVARVERCRARDVGGAVARRRCMRRHEDGRPAAERRVGRVVCEVGVALAEPVRHPVEHAEDALLRDPGRRLACDLADGVRRRDGPAAARWERLPVAVRAEVGVELREEQLSLEQEVVRLETRLGERDPEQDRVGDDACLHAELRLLGVLADVFPRLEAGLHRAPRGRALQVGPLRRRVVGALGRRRVGDRRRVRLPGRRGRRDVGLGCVHERVLLHLVLSRRELPVLAFVDHDRVPPGRTRGEPERVEGVDRADRDDAAAAVERAAVVRARHGVDVRGR